MRKLLLPLSGLYWLGLQAWYLYDKFREKVKFDAFTIVVGNLTVGGTGKSPFVYLLARELLKEFRVAVITRGYGRRSKMVTVLESLGNLPDVEETGDEPMMNFLKLQGKVPFVVCRDRLLAYRVAKDRFSPQVVLLDDAFQYRKIQPDFSFLIFDNRSLRYPGLLLPAGDYRESISAADRADAFVFNLKNGDSFSGFPSFLPLKPYMVTRYRVVGFLNGPPDGLRVIAFSGIGDPGSFLNLLKDQGFEVVEFRKFKDHHWYSQKDIEELRRYGFPIVTTEKDFVKLRDRRGVHAVVIEPEIIEGAGIFGDLMDRIRGSIL